MSAILEYLGCLWDAFVAFLYDISVWVFRGIVEAFASIADLLSVPEALTSGLSSVYSALDPGLLYFLNVSSVPAALAIIGAGVVFRITRKLVTLGKW